MALSTATVLRLVQAYAIVVVQTTVAFAVVPALLEDIVRPQPATLERRRVLVAAHVPAALLHSVVATAEAAVAEEAEADIAVKMDLICEYLSLDINKTIS